MGPGRGGPLVGVGDVTEIRRVASTLGADDDARARIDEIFDPAPVTHVAAGDRRGVEAVLDQVDVAVLRGNAWPAFLDRPQLRWVHCGHAGLDGYAPEQLIEQVVLTSSSGRSAQALAEHAVALTLALCHDLERFGRARRLRAWGVDGARDLRGLGSRTVLIVGTGHTGRALARLLAAFGCRVVGFRRSAEPAEGFTDVRSIEGGDRLIDVVADVDVVVLAASLNRSSLGMLDAEVLSAMRPGALLVNVARGALVDEDALVAALRSGRLGGAALDVVTEEPLPVRHPLWSAPRLVMTPHVTPPVHDRAAATLEILAENVRRYRSDQELFNRLGPSDALEPVSRRPIRRLDGVWRRMARRFV
ncbi:MAG: NAD(P)-dependent oxidoreductase [Actinomycetota bacterium]